ncbi:MAG: family 1 glycosylhydrolase, partial [Myxococcota bacterium]|nr:family 1 glycosylhydrolase [Myxococcota bacterium]
GTATAAHQVEGGNDNNNWYWWESQVDKKGNPRIARNQKSGKACEYWTRYPEDIARMKDELGMNSYRFSIEWSRIVPEKGAWNQKAMDTYSRMVDVMLENNIKPMATLHHFSHPIWFHDMGSFEKEENIAYFVDFSQKVFSQLSDRVPNWCTHNESGPFATMGWGIGAFPPGKQDTNLMFDVLCNLMRSHVQVYHTLKSMENGGRVRIGLVKNIFQFDPYHRWNLAHTMLCRFFDSVYNESVIALLRDGTFKITLDYKNDYIAEIPKAKLAADFVGLNYYSNLLISLSRAFDPHKALTRPGQIVTDFPYATYPEGFYRAIMRMASIGLPIIITENGIPDNKDDRRADWIRRYAYAMKRAMNDGANVEGYHYWTLMDNFEWAEGYDMRFGLYEVDFKTQARTLRPGAQPLLDLVAKHKKDWAGK